jgi:hypothetical protein
MSEPTNIDSDITYAENVSEFLAGHYTSGVLLLSKYNGQTSSFISIGFGDHFSRRGLIETFLECGDD